MEVEETRLEEDDDDDMDNERIWLPNSISAPDDEEDDDEDDEVGMGCSSDELPDPEQVKLLPLSTLFWGANSFVVSWFTDVKLGNEDRFFELSIELTSDSDNDVFDENDWLLMWGAVFELKLGGLIFSSWWWGSAWNLTWGDCGEMDTAGICVCLGSLLIKVNVNDSEPVTLSLATRLAKLYVKWCFLLFG